MRLITLAFGNIKGQRRRIDLDTRALLIYGPNDTGKTTIIDALKLLLLRFHPGLDKTAREIIRVLGGGQEVDVTGHFDNGAMIQRRYSPKGAGGTIAESDGLPLDKQATPVVLLDANEYFGATDRGKVEMMFAVGRLETRADFIEKMLKELDALMPDCDGIKSLGGASNQERVANALQIIEQMRSEAAASVKRMEGTLQGFAHLRSNDAVKPLDEGAEATLTRLRGELDGLQRQLADRKLLTGQDNSWMTPEEKAMDDKQRRLKTVMAFLEEKEKDYAKQSKKWEKLLDPNNKLFCPACMANAKKKADSDLAEIHKHKLALGNDVATLGIDLATLRPIAEKARAKLNANNREKEMKIAEDIMAKREQIETAEAGYQGVVNERADRKRLAEAQGERERYTKQHDQLKAAKAYLLEVKAKMVNELFDPILKTAALFTKGTFFETHPIEFFGGELGIHRDGNWVPHKAFGGARQSIAFAALQAALGATAPLKIVVMDELGRVDEKNKAALLKNIAAALKAGVIDQFIGIDVTKPKLLPKSFSAMSSEEKRK